jgi:hypothetical protein
MNNPLFDRTVSAFPLSVGTSLALESIFETNSPSIDPSRVIPQHINIADYNGFWLNASTLIRNIFQSVEKMDQLLLTAEMVVEVLLSELNIIDDLIRKEGARDWSAILYACTYKEATSFKKNSLVRFRTDKTDNQLFYRSLHNNAIALLVQKLKPNKAIKTFDSELKNDNRGKILILTHIAYDLLSSKSFQQLDLLESHTGVLKPKHLYYTKYFNGKELYMIPFNKAFLSLFGDRELFSPQSINSRKAIVDLARQKRWSQTTTIDKIKNDIKNLRDPILYDFINSRL